MTLSMSNNLDEIVAAIDWPEPYLATAFFADAEKLWGTESGRNDVKRWVSVIGQPSQFVPGKMWLAKDLKEHFAQWDKFAEENQTNNVAPEVEPEVPELPVVRTGPGRPPKGDPTKRQMAAQAMSDWHDAVKKRREVVAERKKEMEVKIAELRAEHAKFVGECDEYVAALRAAARALQQECA